MQLLEDLELTNCGFSGICNRKWPRGHCSWVLHPFHNCGIDGYGDWRRSTSPVQSRYTPIHVVCNPRLNNIRYAFIDLSRLGFQIVFGAGAGIGLELPNIAVQTVLSEKDVSIGTSLVVFARSLGGAIFVSEGENVFSNQIASGMLSQVPELDPSIVLQAGATNLQRTVTQATSGQADVVARVLKLYNDAILQAFLVSLVLACVSVISAVGVEWRTVKHSKEQSDTYQGEVESIRESQELSTTANTANRAI